MRSWIWQKKTLRLDRIPARTDEEDLDILTEDGEVILTESEVPIRTETSE